MILLVGMAGDLMCAILVSMVVMVKKVMVIKVVVVPSMMVVRIFMDVPGIFVPFYISRVVLKAERLNLVDSAAMIQLSKRLCLLSSYVKWHRLFWPPPPLPQLDS